MSKVNDYLKEIKEKVNASNLIFRGQSNKKWEILSSATRRLKNSNINKSKTYYDKYNKNLIKQAKLYKYDKNGELNDIELLSKLQHYGASTGLIDFSSNFLIALWFASDDTSKDQQF